MRARSGKKSPFLKFCVIYHILNHPNQHRQPGPGSHRLDLDDATNMQPTGCRVMAPVNQVHFRVGALRANLNGAQLSAL